MPLNCGDFCPDLQRRVNLYDFTWLVYIIESLDRNIGAWHDSITLQILPGIKIGVKYIRYTSEYIPKLQIHQQSHLTRKVLSWHNSSTQVFVTGSNMDHHWIIIKAGSSLDHHQNYIITRSSSKVDHHCFCYLDQLVLSLNSTHHRKFYRARPFSFWL